LSREVASRVTVLPGKLPKVWNSERGKICMFIRGWLGKLRSFVKEFTLRS